MDLNSPDGQSYCFMVMDRDKEKHFERFDYYRTAFNRAAELGPDFEVYYGKNLIGSDEYELTGVSIYPCTRRIS